MRSRSNTAGSNQNIVINVGPGPEPVPARSGSMMPIFAAAVIIIAMLFCGAIWCHSQTSHRCVSENIRVEASEAVSRHVPAPAAEHSWMEAAGLASVPLALGAAAVLGSRSSDTSVLEKIGQALTPAPVSTGTCTPSGILCGAAALAIGGFVAHKTGLFSTSELSTVTNKEATDALAASGEEPSDQGRSKKKKTKKSTFLGTASDLLELIDETFNESDDEEEPDETDAEDPEEEEPDVIEDDDLDFDDDEDE